MTSTGSLAVRRRPRRVTVSLFSIALVLLLLAAFAGACSAAAVRFGDHPPYARAVVDFAGGTIGARSVEATDPNRSTALPLSV